MTLAVTKPTLFQTNTKSVQCISIAYKYMSTQIKSVTCVD